MSNQFKELVEGVELNEGVNVRDLLILCGPIFGWFLAYLIVVAPSFFRDSYRKRGILKRLDSYYFDPIKEVLMVSGLVHHKDREPTRIIFGVHKEKVRIAYTAPNSELGFDKNNPGWGPDYEKQYYKKSVENALIMSFRRASRANSITRKFLGGVIRPTKVVQKGTFPPNEMFAALKSQNGYTSIGYPSELGFWDMGSHRDYQRRIAIVKY